MGAGRQLHRIALLARVGRCAAHCLFDPGGTIFASDSACSSAIVLPRTPAGLARRRAAYSGCEQPGHVSLIAHRTVTDTTDRHTEQRTRTGPTIGLSPMRHIRRADPGLATRPRSPSNTAPAPPRRARQRQARLYRAASRESIPAAVLAPGFRLSVPVRWVCLRRF
jgi:hypothetical protein